MRQQLLTGNAGKTAGKKQPYGWKSPELRDKKAKEYSISRKKLFQVTSKAGDLFSEKKGKKRTIINQKGDLLFPLDLY